MKKVVWLIILIAIAILIVMGLRNEEKEVFDNFADESNSVVLADQLPGERTVVSYAKLSKPGYVLVYGTDSNNDKVLLGSSDLLPVGDSFNVVVQHEGQSTMSGTKVMAEVVADDGDGVYNSEEDTNTLEKSSEADVDVNATDPASLTIEDIAKLLDDEGYDVTVDEVLEDEKTETSDTEMTEESSDTETGVESDTTVESETTTTTE